MPDLDRAKKLDMLARQLREIVGRSRESLGQGLLSWPERSALEEGGAEEAPQERSVRREAEDDGFLLGRSVEYTLSMDSPLPFGPELSHHFIDGKHLWVSTMEGGLIVLDDKEHSLFVRLKDRETPARLIDALSVSEGTSGQEAWSALSPLIGRLATSGFIKGIKGYTERRLPTPDKFSRFHLTKACQLECIHCYADSSPYVDRRGELPTERWIRLAREFAENGGQQIVFTGGEALLHEGCLELMRLSKSLGLYVTLFTNGILVPKYAKQIQETADKVQVSLDGPDEHSNDAVRGKETFRRILRAVDTLLEHGVPTRIGMTVLEENWEAWKTGFLKFAERYAGTPVEFKLSYGLTNYGRAESLREVDVNITRPVVDNFMAQIHGAKGPKVFRAQSGCGYCEQLVVGPDGVVYPCHLLDAPVCHIDDHPLPDLIAILKNTARLVDVDHVEGCDVCDIRYLCGGTCRVMDGMSSGSRLVTTCTPAIKEMKYRAFVQHFAV